MQPKLKAFLCFGASFPLYVEDTNDSTEFEEMCKTNVPTFIASQIANCQFMASYKVLDDLQNLGRFLYLSYCGVKGRGVSARKVVRLMSDCQWRKKLR